ncbi:MAG TPA: fumarate hydratase, partial [Nitrospirae bacterium]|nr:fumarate hydratase [Nitrospirota bacterium]
MAFQDKTHSAERLRIRRMAHGGTLNALSLTLCALLHALCAVSLTLGTDQEAKGLLKLKHGIAELYRKVATSLPSDIENELKKAHAIEDEGIAKEAMKVVLENIALARKTSRPVCQDTGVPTFFVKIPQQLSQKELSEIIIAATREATEKVPLRPNAVDILTDKNSGDNTGKNIPVIYFEETEEHVLTIDLMLKGSGCENAGQIYKLPAEEINAQRDLDGVRKCIIDTVFKAQGRGCPPYTLGIGIGATKDQVSVLAKRQLLRRIDERDGDEEIHALQVRLLDELNQLGIGPLGFGGKTTVIGVNIDYNHR